MTTENDFFGSLVWQQDRLLLGNLVFRLQHYLRDDWELGDQCFLFYKTQKLIDQYAAYWRRRPDFHPQNILELGLWDGGSMAFWFEYFQPQQHVGVDIQAKVDSPYFQQYLASRGVEKRIKCCWQTDQADSQRLQEIAKTEFSGPLDLVIDDASHLYPATKTSFETLFPLLRPGGIYIIEDWAWGHWKDFQAPNHPWAKETPLTKLVTELIEATGSGTNLISNVTVFQGFAAIERGPADTARTDPITLESLISRKQVPTRTD